MRYALTVSLLRLLCFGRKMSRKSFVFEKNSPENCFLSMAHHLRYHVARNGVFIVHCAVGITDKVIVIKSFLCCFMPEISAQIRHHHLEVNAFFRPQVHPVNHKRETEVMDGLKCYTKVVTGVANEI